MVSINIEKGLDLERVSEVHTDKFRAIQTPFTWDAGGVIPGGLLMALCTTAAYETVSSDFSIASLQTHFLLGPRNNVRIDLQVQRLSDGGRFATRLVSLLQNNRIMVHVTCSFVRTSAMGGPSMAHSASRATNYRLDAITLDDLDYGRTELGPYMKYQRFPLVYAGREQPEPVNPRPEDLVHPCAAIVSPAIRSDDRRLHLLGIILLSDYHVLDCPPTIHGLTFGPAAVNDTTRTRTPQQFNMLTSLNHSILFHVHEGFRADEMCYVEATSPWSGNRRGEILSRIFSKDGRLIATCKQEGYYVLKGDKKDGKL
ncbi:hypothetical protein M409DRAFT_49889 [Zasmidium cellare ATCC 36951]|uniref:Acyl-CoA thioesterase II n=1 Tax=Zasmidium cellare ATCC 36951 TaxID=1080233 RepID=A0A6A6D122_ZASCE|nr:uncharacterized protein M409DRAFT_49889 [Zasmidium cellare ATCC 36951]KAF2172150.1 hypothetical protein M409DRAFT_49889 [Zasmidium cellare ATCC 36951]